MATAAKPTRAITVKKVTKAQKQDTVTNSSSKVDVKSFDILAISALLEVVKTFVALIKQLKRLALPSFRFTVI